MTDGPPLAFSGSRLAWSDLPRAVRERIAALAGASVIAEAPATTGFSPGYASLLELGDGTEVFVKAVSAEQNPDSPGLARAEIRSLGLLPAAVPAPRLLWSHDDGTWVAMGIEAVPGRTPEHPWQPDQLARVLDVVTVLAEAGTPAPPELPPLRTALAGLAETWLHTDTDAVLSAVGEQATWLAAHLDRATAWAADAPRLAVGRCLAHNDLRADNVLLGEHRTWVVDWPHASRDAPAWYDLAGLLPSVAMQGGGDPAELFWAHPTARDADPAAVRAVVAALAGYFLGNAVRPAPVGIANLRAFQLAQGLAALEWLSGF